MSRDIPSGKYNPGMVTEYSRTCIPFSRCSALMVGWRGGRAGARTGHSRACTLTSNCCEHTHTHSECMRWLVAARNRASIPVLKHETQRHRFVGAPRPQTTEPDHQSRACDTHQTISDRTNGPHGCTHTSAGLRGFRTAVLSGGSHHRG